MPDESTRPPSPGRVVAIDAVRGIAIVLMILDHCRRGFRVANFPPTDVARTSSELFLTRWVTHVAAPTFVFLAGVSIALFTTRHAGRSVSAYLFKRGLFLILMELTVVKFCSDFGMDYNFTYLQVIWAIGASMVLMAGLVHLPRPAGALLGLAFLVSPNVLQATLPPDRLDGAVVHLLAVPGGFTLDGMRLQVSYPALPWCAMMLFGFASAPTLLRLLRERRWPVFALGAVLCAAFAVLRYLDLDLDPWRFYVQGTSEKTLMAFLNATKYPPSPGFTLMTLGPMFLLLAGAASLRDRLLFVPATIGRAAMTLYLLHLLLIQILELLADAFPGPFAAFGLAPVAGTGLYTLPQVYWLTVVVTGFCFLAALGYVALRRRTRHPVFSYI